MHCHGSMRVHAALSAAQAGPIGRCLLCCCCVHLSRCLAPAPSPPSPPLPPKAMAKSVSREGRGACRAALGAQDRARTRPGRTFRGGPSHSNAALERSWQPQGFKSEFRRIFRSMELRFITIHGFTCAHVAWAHWERTGHLSGPTRAQPLDPIAGEGRTRQSASQSAKIWQPIIDSAAGQQADELGHERAETHPNGDI